MVNDYDINNCLRKVGHESEHGAYRHMYDLATRQGSRGLHVYKCPIENHYHVGHKPAKRR